MAVSALQLRILYWLNIVTIRNCIITQCEMAASAAVENTVSRRRDTSVEPSLQEERGQPNIATIRLNVA